MSGPGSVAEYDQLLAQARMELDMLRKTLVNLRAKRGEQQGMADMLAMLGSWPQDRVISALAAALTEPTGECVP